MRIKNLPSIESMDGSQDALVIEQTDGSEDKSRKVSPAQIKQYVQTGDFTATGEITDGHGNVLADMAKADEVKGIAEAGDFEATGEVKDGHGNVLSGVVDEIGDLSQTGLTGDSVAEQLTIAKNQIAARTECFISSSNGAAQSIKIGAIAENRIFLFACGFHTNYVLELIAISSNGANVVHVPVANSSINSISNISYDANSGVMSITVQSNPFGYGRMTRLS